MDGPRTAVNLSTGSDRSKSRWRPTVRVACDGVHLAQTLRASLAYRAYPFARLGPLRSGLLGRLLSRRSRRRSDQLV